MANFSRKAKVAEEPLADASARRAAPARASYADALDHKGRELSIDAYLETARALLATGHAAEAFQSADRALALGADGFETWRLIGASLEALGETALAASACERALIHDGDRADLHVALGRLYEALDRPFDAAARYQRAIALDANLVDAHVALSGLFGRAGQFAIARTHAEAALALAPDCFGAHQNLAAISEHEGQLEEAEAHRERSFRAAPLIIERAVRPRRRVLTLASAARANSPDRYLIPPTRYDRLTWFIGYADPARGDPDGFDVVFNAIADADAAASTAEKAAAFLARCSRPALNSPELIAATARNNVARLFAGIDNLLIPETTRVRAGSDLSNLDDDALYLLRPIGSHGGERLLKLSSSQVREGAEAGEHYLTVFHDFRSADGLYRKYRVFFVDREPYPYHLAIHSDWLVHYQNTDTAARPESVAEELRFLSDPQAALGADAWRAVAQIGERLDLDFAGVDFAICPDGRVLLFEANATMYAHPEPPDGPLAHKNPFIQRIFEAFWARLERA